MPDSAIERDALFYIFVVAFYGYRRNVIISWQVDGV